jgi:B-box zinc finger
MSIVVDLICPDCRGELQMESLRWAVCVQHGGRFEVLFDRHAEQSGESLARSAGSAAVASQSREYPVPSVPHSGARCSVHPGQDAVATCQTCGTPLCASCRSVVAGQSLCSTCATEHTSVPPGQKLCPQCGLSMPSSMGRCDCGHQFGLLNLSAPLRKSAPSGTCVDHPEMPAVVRCKLCAKAICATCDFALPGGVHLCPSCIESQSSDEISPKRKKKTYIALALASWSTILFAMLFTGVFKSLLMADAGGKAADAVITNLILWPLLIGTGLSLGALDKKLRNTGLMRAVAWWNSILAGIFLLMIVGVNIGLIGK